MSEPSSLGLNERLIINYDEIYKNEILDFNLLDKENIVSEKNAVILSRMFMMSQLTIAEFVYKSIYVKRNQFDKMWKLYKNIAIKHKLRPEIDNGNLIYSPSFSKIIRNIDNKFVLEG